MSYKTYEIKDILNVKPVGRDPHAAFIISSHINKLLGYYCNSSYQDISELDYVQTLNDEQAVAFVKNFYPIILSGAKELYDMMGKGEIEVTHDFYLKKFQLTSPQLKYDYILFDEGQDASAAMLDIFLKQSATKVIVGDSHQQIYSWRHAVNSLEKVEFSDYYLTRSFRFNEEIGFLAMKVLRMKSHFMNYEPVNVWGSSVPGEIRTRAIIARTNLSLLQAAITLVCMEEVVNKIYFEGSLDSYTYVRDGASLDDVLFLYEGEHSKIKDRILRRMDSFQTLKSYIDKTGDVELGMLYSIVNEYKKEIPGLIATLKEKHVSEENRGDVELIFSTVHKCKGMEYDEVTLMDDFISEDSIMDKIKEGNLDSITLGAINEEINLLYVAITRAKSILNIAENLLPEFESVFAIAADNEEPDYFEETEDISSTRSQVDGQSCNPDISYKIKIAKIRATYPNAYNRWTQEDDEKLEFMYCEGKKIKLMSELFGRQPSAIRSRIEKLDFENKYPGIR